MSFLKRIKNLVIPPDEAKIAASVEEVTNNRILNELVECFDDSLRKESVGTSLLFNAHFLIILHPDTYETRLPSLPVVVKEAVKAFYNKLQKLKVDYEDISPVSANWHFKFGPGVEFNNEKVDVHDVKVIGMLTGLKESGSQAKTKVTMKPKKSNVYDKMDVNLDALRHIDFRESGAFTVKFNPDLRLGAEAQPRAAGGALAQIEYYLGDKDQEETYQMRDKEIVVARKEVDNQGYSNYLLVDSPYVSNPHARIRYNEAEKRFQIASFSRNETRVNERIIPKSELADPQWFDLAPKSQILLNSLVTLTFQSNL
ncbi:FHA domain-containing protein [Tellurirhabdus bombi]|uniref:FHA domain-containing protein n=1 Tax=Tellurirhabdus bombi TaxID=2907205 RepID=UPI001F29B7CD|nr:FHA domain-containing protein [Tellurirhabdus bombi]